MADLKTILTNMILELTALQSGGVAAATKGDDFPLPRMIATGDGDSILISKKIDQLITSMATVLWDEHRTLRVRFTASEWASKRRQRAQGTPLSEGAAPNDLWCADYKGEFRLGDTRYCYPLTVTDQSSRFLLLCEAQESTRAEFAFPAFERLFQKRGLPAAIRSDNGVPFASPNGLYTLSKLSVWWLRLGIDIERIKPGCPQQNGRHERMHRTLRGETTRPPGMNFLQQQARFDAFVEEFNTERPHEALDMKRPADLYVASARLYRGLPEVEYPLHDRDVLVTSCGRICMHRKKINISTALAGQKLGIKEVDEGIWLVSFMRYDLGYIDLEQKTLQTLDNPFGPRLSPMSPG